MPRKMEMIPNPMFKKTPTMLTEEYIRDNPIPVIAHPQYVIKHVHQDISWCYVYSVNFGSFLLGAMMGYVFTKHNIIQ